MYLDYLRLEACYTSTKACSDDTVTAVAKYAKSVQQYAYDQEAVRQEQTACACTTCSKCFKTNNSPLLSHLSHCPRSAPRRLGDAGQQTQGRADRWIPDSTSRKRDRSIPDNEEGGEPHVRDRRCLYSPDCDLTSMRFLWSYISPV